MANETHTLKFGNTSFPIEPLTLGAKSTYATNANFSAIKQLRFDTLIGNSPFGSAKSTGYNNAVISISRYSDDKYTSQIGFSGYGMYARHFSNKAVDSTTPWKQILTDDGYGTVIFNKNSEVAKISDLNINVNSFCLAASSTSSYVEIEHAEYINLMTTHVDSPTDYSNISQSGSTLSLTAAGSEFPEEASINLTSDYIHINGYNGWCESYLMGDLHLLDGGGVYYDSDENLKTFGDDITVDLDTLATLRKSHFVFNTDPDKQQIGVSAQEIQRVYPEIVTECKDGHLTVDYSKLSVIALAAIDELHKKNTELEERLAKLEALVEQISSNK
jgi:hypothetical protein